MQREGFHLMGDLIYFDGQLVACIVTPTGTLRDRFEKALLGTDERDYDTDPESE